VVATAILGGLFHGGSGPELGEIDIEVCTSALEKIQCETVNSSDDAFLPLMTVAQHERIVAALTRPAQTEQQPDGEAVEIVASAIDGPCREVESIDDMAQIICGQLAEAGFLRVRKSEAANFAAPIAGVLCRFGLSRDDAEALGAELAIALIPHLAQWDEDHHAAPIAQTAPQPEQSGLPDPRQWTDQQVLDFLGVALRNVDVVGTVHLNEIRQGFELVMGRPSLPDQGGARE